MTELKALFSNINGCKFLLFLILLVFLFFFLLELLSTDQVPSAISLARFTLQTTFGTVRVKLARVPKKSSANFVYTTPFLPYQKARLHDRGKVARFRLKWNGSIHFCKELVNFYPFRYGTIGTYGPVAERIKVHCFFTKMIGTVPLVIGIVPFFLCRVNAPKNTVPKFLGPGKFSCRHAQFNYNQERPRDFGGE